MKKRMHDQNAHSVVATPSSSTVTILRYSSPFRFETPCKFLSVPVCCSDWYRGGLRKTMTHGFVPGDLFVWTVSRRLGVTATNAGLETKRWPVLVGPSRAYSPD